MIPVIDLFAGPGGLGEGFSAFCAKPKKNFKIVLSIEKDKWARETLRLRSFFRQFTNGAPETYYDYLRGAISIEELFLRHPEEAAKASTEAWLAELGNPEKFPISVIDDRIRKALAGSGNWVLIGGPPCQAYSIVGRSRMARQPEKHKKDHRHFLYQEYLRILAVHRPPVFVMENVKGILSSRVEEGLIIDKILADLKRPSETNGRAGGHEANDQVTYRLFQFANYPHYGQNERLFEEIESNPSRYIIECERHGIPQARHRVILLGVRSDLKAIPKRLPISREVVSVWKVVSDLPRLRSQLSAGHDSDAAWVTAIQRLADPRFSLVDGIDTDVLHALQSTAKSLTGSLSIGAEFVPTDAVPKWQRSWFQDLKLKGVCNHQTRAHLTADLWRYFFAACFANARGKSPVLTDFPERLLPEHKNARNPRGKDEVSFDDRFRVQVKNRFSTTITAHIGKDGHYFIHPDPLQCRSLTVREAARLQTFPDNYFFVGPRTQQYIQVGNAVPPLLARALAGIVHGVLAGES